MKIKSYTKNNFENEAREKRYKFYEHLLKEYNSHNLFLAHHGDDLIETVLMKILRGSNLEGYAGIKLYSQLENYKIIRFSIDKYESTSDDIYNALEKILEFLRKESMANGK
jgi:tRNA(Ile)-lysidine synthase TilS/MesJ